MCAMPYSHPQAHPKGYNTNIGKEDVLSWFRSISAASRVDAIVGLLDCCLPFEIRFIGSAVERYAKKSSAELREVGQKANLFYKRTASLDENREILFSNLSQKDDNLDDFEGTVPGSKDLLVLHYETPRQTMCLYLSLLSSTNAEAASVYYSLISQVDRTVGNRKWMEKQDEKTLEEINLLYTLGIHHPAFSFEQRLMLSQILVKVRRELQRNKSLAYPLYAPIQYDPGPYYLQQLPSMPPPPPPPPQVHAVTPNAVKSERQPPPLLEKIPIPFPSHSHQYPPTDANPQSQIVRSEKLCCFNCGLQGHLGHQCSEKNIEQMTAHFYQLNYEDNNNKHD